MSPTTATYLRVNGVSIGHTWYSHSKGAHFGALFDWDTKHKPLGPFKTQGAARKAVERTAKSEGLWPNPMQVGGGQEQQP